MSHAKLYLAEAAQITERIDYDMIERIAEGLADLRDRGGRGPGSITKSLSSSAFLVSTS